MLKKITFFALSLCLLASPAFVAAQSACFATTRTLSLGSKGSDVVALQQFLIVQGLLPANDATGFYGSLTEAAVQHFQTAHGIVSSGTPSNTGYGAVGPMTRQLIAASCSSSGPVSGGSCPQYQVPICAANQSLVSGAFTNGCPGPAQCVNSTGQTNSFTANPASGNAPLAVTFYGTGNGVTYFGGVIVNFGDGAMNTFCPPNSPCNQSNVTHTYTTPGTYIAKLVGTAASGSTVLGAVNVTVTGSGASAITSSPNSGNAPLTVVFTGTSNGQYTVDYGDGSPKFQPTCSISPCGGLALNLSHIYANSGTYTATFTDANGTKTMTITVGTASPSGPSGPSGSCTAPAHDLKVGDSDASTGGDVTLLQTYLAKDSSIYPEGLVTGFFGHATEAAVKRFQAKYTILQTGFVGPLTRAAIKTICGGGTVSNSSYSFVASPASTTAGTNVTFAATDAETRDTGIWYAVDFGDGTPKANMSQSTNSNTPTLIVTHAYAQGGTFTVNLLQNEDICGIGQTYQYGCTKQLIVDHTSVTVTGGTGTSTPATTPTAGGACSTTKFATRVDDGGALTHTGTSEFVNYSPDNAPSGGIATGFIQANFGTPTTVTYPNATVLNANPAWHSGTTFVGVAQEPALVGCSNVYGPLNMCLMYQCQNGSWQSRTQITTQMIYGPQQPQSSGGGGSL